MQQPCPARPAGAVARSRARGPRGAEAEAARHLAEDHLPLAAVISAAISGHHHRRHSVRV